MSTLSSNIEHTTNKYNSHEKDSFHDKKEKRGVANIVSEEVTKLLYTKWKREKVNLRKILSQNKKININEIQEKIKHNISILGNVKKDNTNEMTEQEKSKNKELNYIKQIREGYNTRKLLEGLEIKNPVDDNETNYFTAYITELSIKGEDNNNTGDQNNTLLQSRGKYTIIKRNREEAQGVQPNDEKTLQIVYEGRTNSNKDDITFEIKDGEIVGPGRQYQTSPSTRLVKIPILDKDGEKSYDNNGNIRYEYVEITKNEQGIFNIKTKENNISPENQHTIWKTKFQEIDYKDIPLSTPKLLIETSKNGPYGTTIVDFQYLDNTFKTQKKQLYFNAGGHLLTKNNQHQGIIIDGKTYLFYEDNDSISLKIAQAGDQLLNAQNELTNQQKEDNIRKKDTQTIYTSKQNNTSTNTKKNTTPTQKSNKPEQNNESDKNNGNNPPNNGVNNQDNKTGNETNNMNPILDQQISNNIQTNINKISEPFPKDTPLQVSNLHITPKKDKKNNKIIGYEAHIPLGNSAWNLKNNTKQTIQFDADRSITEGQHIYAPASINGYDYLQIYTVTYTQENTPKMEPLNDIDRDEYFHGYTTKTEGLPRGTENNGYDLLTTTVFRKNAVTYIEEKSRENNKDIQRNRGPSDEQSKNTSRQEDERNQTYITYSTDDIEKGEFFEYKITGNENKEETIQLRMGADGNIIYPTEHHPIIINNQKYYASIDHNEHTISFAKVDTSIN